MPGRGTHAMAIARRGLLGLGAGAWAWSALPARAEGDPYPMRPVRMVVPLAAGGGLDFVARLTGESLARAMGQPFVIENKPGAGGMLGIETVARSQPDGYTLLATTDAIAS